MQNALSLPKRDWPGEPGFARVLVPSEINEQAVRHKEAVFCDVHVQGFYMILLYIVPKAPRYHNELFLEQGVLEEVH